ncbi:hypothetical protein LshimejAT787_0602220 [Lyophyllum shimeji]|uniref:RING-type domain-containing protein n=1 Tax=Lyophyllum shimeji TaxID=47721 RepID=A0A9P3PMH1_LYOSH|nr:hypothetical protein LshimejAT787_0602220 [Lyophyllum shimeji]
MPPVCQPCNRQFRNKEAAMQHLQSSGANHPFCNHPRCEGRRFLSEQARDAHMADKHPPTFDCESCNRSFASPSALEDHYRGSPNHPNCSRCGMGFVDGKARDEHHHSTHPRVSCQLCGGLMIYEDVLENHYLDSAKHPQCGTCNQGFKDAAAYEEHQISAHPEPQCLSCEREFPDNETLQRHYYVSPSHPECPLCQIGFKDNVEYQEHLASHPAPSNTRQQLSGSISETSHDLLPPSPSVMNTTTPPQARAYQSQLPASPVLTLQTTLFSPTLRTIWTPDISPAVPLPPPGRDPKFEAAWGAKANIPVTQARPPRMLCAPANEAHGLAAQVALSPAWSQGSNDSNIEAQRCYSIAGTRAPARAFENHPPFNNRTDGDIHPARRSMRTTQKLLLSTQISEAQAARQAATALKYGLYQEDTTRTLTHRHVGTPIPPRSGEPGLASLNGAKASVTSLATSGVVDWVELIGDKAYSVARTQSNRSDDVSSTEAVATPSSAQTAALAQAMGSYGESQMRPNSEQFSAGSFSPWNETPLHVPLPPSTSHSRAGSHPPSIRFTPFSPSSSPAQSPEVTSPVGLALLPTISPLATTPVDICFTSTESRTTDDGPPGASVPFSPFHLAIDTQLPESPSVASLASVTHDGSPGGSGNGDGLNVDILSLPLPDSPSVSELASPTPAVVELTPLLTSSTGLRDIEREVRAASSTLMSKSLQSGFNTRILEKESSTDTVLAAPRTSFEDDVGHDAHTAYSVTEGSIGTAVEEHTPKTAMRVHCRMCRADPCAEPTATLCGHLFCYRCISEHILRDPHCPACSRAAMLNCLLTLHLSDD